MRKAVRAMREPLIEKCLAAVAAGERNVSMAKLTPEEKVYVSDHLERQVAARVAIWEIEGGDGLARCTRCNQRVPMRVADPLTSTGHAAYIRVIALDGGLYPICPPCGEADAVHRLALTRMLYADRVPTAVVRP